MTAEGYSVMAAHLVRHCITKSACNHNLCMAMANNLLLKAIQNAFSLHFCILSMRLLKCVCAFAYTYCVCVYKYIAAANYTIMQLVAGTLNSANVHRLRAYIAIVFSQANTWARAHRI